jgi:hypothetical protein
VGKCLMTIILFWPTSGMMEMFEEKLNRPVKK